MKEEFDQKKDIGEGEETPKGEDIREEAEIREEEETREAATQEAATYDEEKAWEEETREAATHEEEKAWEEETREAATHDEEKGWGDEAQETATHEEEKAWEDEARDGETPEDTEWDQKGESEDLRDTEFEDEQELTGDNTYGDNNETPAVHSNTTEEDTSIKETQPKRRGKNAKQNSGGGFSLKIGSKIALGFLLVILIFGFVSMQTWMAFNDLEDAIFESNAAAQTYNDVAQMDAEIWRQYGYIYEYANLQRTETLPNYEAASERFEELFARVSEGIEDPEIVEELGRIRILKDSMETVLYDSIVPSIGTDAEEFQDRRLRNVESRIRFIGEAFDTISQHIEEETQTIIQDAEGVIASEKQKLIMYLGIALLIAIIVTVVLTRGISKPLKELQKEADRVSKGDLTLAFSASNGKDEIGELSRSFAQMSLNLKTLISSVKEASQKATQSSEILMETAKQSSGASEDLSKTIQEIAETADNQAQNTTEGTQKVTEMAVTIEDVSKSTASLKKSTENADRLREKGVEVVENLFEKTETINQVTSEVSKIIQETDANTEKINKASTVIQSISEQTGLLALNAAIESARAGEAGKGFAVVADEIRKLAVQASSSTKEIEDIVKVLKEKSNVAVRDMKNLEGTISDQGDAVNATKGIFSDLSNAIDSTKDETHGVESYVDIMLGKKDEIVDVINQLASIAEENAASTEEASAATEQQTASMQEIQSASEQLTNLSYELMEVVGEFKV